MFGQLIIFHFTLLLFLCRLYLRTDSSIISHVSDFVMAENTSESSAPPMPRGVGALMQHVRTHKIGTVPGTCHAKVLENVIYVCGVYCMTNNQCCGSGYGSGSCYFLSLTFKKFFCLIIF